MYMTFEKTAGLRAGKRLLMTLLCLLPTSLFAQKTVWIKVDSGTVLNLDPQQMQWVPMSEKQQIPVNSYLLTKPDARAVLVKGTELYPLPPDAYFYVNDIFKRNRIEVVAALTQIEAEQLPENITEPNHDNNKPVGLTYGELQGETAERSDIPHEKQRMNAANWFYLREQFDAALLTLKRVLTRFPALWLRENEADKLFFLYDKFQLYGFLLNDSSRLLTMKHPENLDKVVRSWYQKAEQSLSARPTRE